MRGQSEAALLEVPLDCASELLEIRDIPYNAGMDEQRTMIEKLLLEINIAQKWHVVEPCPGDIKDNVWLQNTEERKDARFHLPWKDLQDLPKDQLKARILDGISKAVIRD